MKRLLVFLTTLVFTLQLSSQNTIIVGDTTSTQTSQYYPAYHLYEDSYTQMLYKSEDLQAGTITSISFYCTQGDWSDGTVKIYMKEVSDNTLTTYSSPEGFVEVYTGLDQNAVGWVNFTLTNPFNYSGEDNLLICFIRDGTSWYGGALSYKISTEPNSVLSTFNDAQSYTINSVLTPQSGYKDERPVIKIEYGELGEFCYPPSNVQIASETIGYETAIVSWIPADEASALFGLAYKKVTEEDWELVSENISANSYTLTGLDSYTRYQVKIWSICSSVISSEVVKDFETLATEDNFISIPYEQNFDNLSMVSNWYFDNPNVNKWYIGSAVNNTFNEDGELITGNALYISSTNGTTNSYSTSTTSVADAYVLMHAEQGNYYGLTFDYKSVGENTYDYLMILLSPFDESGINRVIYQDFSTNNQWKRVSIPFPNDLEEGSYKLVFSWRNDNAGGVNPPAAIDNISIFSTPCARVNNFNVTMQDEGESVAMRIDVVDSLNDNAEYLVEYRYVGDTVWNNVQSTSPIEFGDLSYASNVEFRVKAICGESEQAFVSDTYIRYTLCNPISEFPYIENFYSFIDSPDVFMGNRPAPNCWFNVKSNGAYYWSSASNEGVNNSPALSFVGTTASTSSGFSEWIISPVFELTGNERLNFKYRLPNSSVNLPKIDVYILDSSFSYSSMSDTANFVLLTSFNTANASIDEWETAEALLNSYVGDVRIALVIREASQSFYVDDFSISSIPACPDVYGFTVRPASQSALVSYNTGNISQAGVILAYAPIGVDSVFNINNATTLTIPANYELPFIVEGLTTGTTYAFAVKQNCGGEWTSPIIKTIPFAYSLPISMDFDTTETTPIMTFTGTTNPWVVGNAENNTSTSINGKALYVSQDNGATATYNKTIVAESFASFPVSFAPSAEFELSFDWKCEGEGEYDNLSVYLIPQGDTLNEVYNIISYNGNTYLSGSAEWKTYRKALSNSYLGVYDLVFRWENDHILGTQPAGIIDNIQLTSRSCSSNVNMSLNFVDTISPTIIVDINDEINEGIYYSIRYKANQSTDYIEIENLTENSFPYTITEGIEYQTIYDFQIGVMCSNTEISYSELQTITTPCVIVEAPWFENFETNVLASPSCWDIYSGNLSQSGTTTTSQLTSISNTWKIENENMGNQASSFLKLDLSSATRNHWAMSPIIDLGDGSSIKQIAFDLGARNENLSSSNKIVVLVSTDAGETWNINNSIIFADGDADTSHNFSDLNNQMTRYAYKLVDVNNQALRGEVRFAFYGETSAYNLNNIIFIDDISIEEWSECQMPYGIEISRITSTAAEACFKTWGSATTWEYVVVAGTDEELLNTITPIVISTTENIDVSGLLPTTDYIFGVRSVCGNSIVSPWAIARFTTKESGASIPYSTSFNDTVDASTWHTTQNETNNIWTIGNATSTNTPSAAYISSDNGLTYSAESSSNITYSYIWKDFSFGETDDLFELSFDWKVRGRSTGEVVNTGLAVYLTTYDTPPTNAFPAEEERVTLLYASDSWQNEKIFLDNIRGDKRLVFLTWGYTSEQDTLIPAAIDNVSLYTTTCTPPTSVPEVAEIIGNSAIILWEDADANHNQWNVYYKPLGASTYSSVSVSDLSVELNNLLPSTTYSLYVTADCGETESAHSRKITFTTECPLIQIPYEETFDTDVARNICWNTARGLLTENVTFINNEQYWFQSNDIIGDDSTSKMKINIYGDNARQHWLISPQIDLGNSGNLYQLSLDVALRSYSVSDDEPQPAPDDVFAIVVSIDGGLTWSRENAMIFTDADDDTEHNFSDFNDTSFTRITYLLQDDFEVPLSGLIKIGFYGESTVYNGDNNLYIDNLYIGPIIEEVEPCEAPIELSATNISSTTAEVSWQGSTDTYELKINGGEAEVLTSTSKILTGLTPTTQYIVEVRSICEVEQSAWIAISFTTTEGVVLGEVTTQSATQITNTSATLNGILVNSGDSDNFTLGFALSTIADFQLEDEGVQNIVVENVNPTFNAIVNNLVEGETYFFKAYIANEAGLAYGEVKSFTLLGLNETITNTIKAYIYPNPSHKQASLCIEGLNTDAKIIITDLQGRIVSEAIMKANASKYILDLSAMSSGVYYVRIVAGETISTQKLIVE